MRAAGYLSTKKDGSERLNFTAFYEALLEAKGISVGGATSTGKGKAGRNLGFITKVQFNGNLLVCRPGDLRTKALELFQD